MSAPATVVDGAAQLLAWVADTPGLMAALRAARALGLADWAIGAGAVRNLVWDRLHGHAEPTPWADVDLVFHDAAVAAQGLDANAEYERHLQGRLVREGPALARALPWEVTNQAAVHLWLQRADGCPVRPLASVAEGVAGWPETATAVAVWLDRQDRLQLIAPLGLQDLLALRLRRNVAAVDRDTYRQRLTAKPWTARWPRLVVDPG